MNRRSIFKLFASAIVASSMEAMGVRPVAMAGEIAPFDYSFKAQMAKMIRNFEMNILSAWEDRDVDKYRDGVRFTSFKFPTIIIPANSSRSDAS